MITIEKKSLCCGCTACEQICPKHCIVMQSDEEGFTYPIANLERCINCGLCERVCPIVNKKKSNNVPKGYATYNKDEEERKHSSSGGVFSLLARQILLDGGIVFGAVMSEDCRRVQHISIANIEDLAYLQGSKYVQSDIGKTYIETKEYLQKGKKVLFSGTPCEIAGLKTFLQRNYENLFCIDVVCHGVPSPKVWEKYIDYREQCASSNAKWVYFRNKQWGWKRYSIWIKFSNNTLYKCVRTKDMFMQMFLQNLCLRPSCYECVFKGEKRNSDITLADFWNCGSICPELDDNKGLSLILIHSEKGEALFDIIKEKTISQTVELNGVIEKNFSLMQSCRKPEKREQFMQSIDDVALVKLGKMYLQRPSTVEKLKQIIPDNIKRNIYKLWKVH